ncbi:MAG TPA: hypothetical protein VHQ69_17265 [Methylomirabilota bacterium]|nr:hypothetical protein [Methylomirabilota bacterium]
MGRGLGMLVALLLAAGCASTVTAPRREGPPVVLMMASMIGPIDAGIVEALEDAYRRTTGVDVRHVGAGTGAALDMAKSGSSTW